ncbi:MAG: hypothetical protein KatS3mg110_0933 [Pirellulaceae bacterium]|nr:MAG: hypothetical protein KatS3mg110_0933 [Pirellulaceae bacterium]
MAAWSRLWLYSFTEFWITRLASSTVTGVCGRRHSRLRLPKERSILPLD